MNKRDVNSMLRACLTSKWNKKKSLWRDLFYLPSHYLGIPWTDMLLPQGGVWLNQMEQCACSVSYTPGW